MELSKHGFNEMPDFTLGVLQSRFSAKNLEDLYKKYEQRYQLSKSDQYLPSNRNDHILVCRQFHHFSPRPVSHSLRDGLLWLDSPQHLLLPGPGERDQHLQVISVRRPGQVTPSPPLTCRYPDHVYQIDLMIQVTICLVFAFLTFYVIKWEKLLKEKKWLVYTVSLGSIALIEVIPCE